MKKHAAMLIGCAAPLIVAGCVPMLPPVQLLSARGAYVRADAGVAARYATAELRQAKIALEAAEMAFAEEGDVARTRDLAYVARRRAQLAMVQGETVATKMSRDEASGSPRAQPTVRTERAAQAEHAEHANDATIAPPPGGQDRSP